MTTLNQWLRFAAALTITLCLVACGGEDVSDATSDTADGDAASTTDTLTDKDGSTSAESTDVSGKILDETEKVVEVLKEVKDVETAQAAAQYIMGFAERNKELTEQFKALATSEQIASAQKYFQRTMDVQKMMQEQITRINLSPELKQYLEAAFNALKQQ